MRYLLTFTLLFVLAAPQVMAFSCYELRDPYEQQSCVHQEDMIRLQQQQMIDNNWRRY